MVKSTNEIKELIKLKSNADSVFTDQLLYATENLFLLTGYTRLPKIT